MNKLPDTNKGTVWEKNSEYLRNRSSMWNPDYFIFLVNHVWKIDKPVKIADFGCGLGYLGQILLPLLPKGSTYTGFDVSGMLIEEAREIFSDTEWDAEFVEQDVRTYALTEKYDIAICQTLLIHIPNPIMALEKMVQSVVTGGRVICIEPNWAFTYVGTYKHGMPVYSYADWGVYQKFFDIEVQRGGYDRYIGIKIPAMMHDLGLKNIDIRINDKASFDFREPDKKKLEKDKEERKNNRFDNLEFYIKAGIDKDEAERHIENILLAEDYENNHDEPLPVVSAAAWLVSFGEK